MTRTEGQRLVNCGQGIINLCRGDKPVTGTDLMALRALAQEGLRGTAQRLGLKIEGELVGKRYSSEDEELLDYIRAPF